MISRIYKFPAETAKGKLELSEKLTVAEIEAALEQQR